MKVPGSNTLRLILSLFALSIMLTGCDTSSTKDKDLPTSSSNENGHHFVFRARMEGYYGVGGDIESKKNPTLRVTKGDHITITIINDEPMAHDIVLEQHNVRSEILIRRGEQTSITFVAREDDTYFCSIPGHLEAGMIGTLLVLQAK